MIGRQTIRPEQTLTEIWEVTYTRRSVAHDIEASIMIPHSTVTTGRGYGKTVDAARLDALANVASAYIDVDECDAVEEGDPPMISDRTLDFLFKKVSAARRGRHRRKEAVCEGSSSAS